MAAKFDFKSILVNHSEKLVASLVVLLLGWCMYKTSFDWTEITPSKITSQAEKVRSDVERKLDLPPKELAFFTDWDPSDIKQLEGDLLQRDELNYQRFTTQTVWNPLLNPLQEKRGGVVVLAPSDAEVASVSVPLAMYKDPGEVAENETNVARKEVKKQPVNVGAQRANDEYGVSRPAARNSGGGGGGGNVFGGGGGGRGLSLSSRGRGRDDDDDGGLRRRRRRNVEQPTRPQVADHKVEWWAGISVRMIVNLRNQRQQIARALNMQGNQTQAAQQLIEYQQMHIERQEYRHEEWSDWEPLLLEDVSEVLEASMGLDIDIVSPAVTRDGITMPLPRRAAGKWQEHQASHAKVVNFELDEDEQEIVNQILEDMAQAAEEAAEKEPPERKRKKGFGDFVRSTGVLRQGARDGFGAGRDAFGRGVRARVQESFANSDREFGDREGEIFDKQFNQLVGGGEDGPTADDRLLLVRFFDFTAERGIQYRYRVRLEMYNPNYNVNIDELEFPELRDDETIFSEWSEPTAAAMVPSRYRNHVRRVKTDSLARRSAEFRVYYEEDGILPVMESLPVEVGMPVCGKKKSERVDLERQEVADGDIEIATDEVLVGIIPQNELRGTDNPDLKETLSQFRRSQDPVGDLVCVVDSTGSIVMRYAAEASDALKVDQEMVDSIMANYRDWRGPQDGGGALEGGGGNVFGGGGGGNKPQGFRTMMRQGSALSTRPGR